MIVFKANIKDVGVFMNQEYIVKLVSIQKYLRTNRSTGESEIVTVSNRNELPVWKHLELLNQNDEEYRYSEIEPPEN